MKKSLLYLACAVLIAPLAGHADTTITTDTTQDGGVFVVTPPNLWITDVMNDPTLTLTGGATASWAGATIVGNDRGNGSLEILDGSRLENLYDGRYSLSGRGYIGGSSIGSDNSKGFVRVSGFGSEWIARDGLHIGFSGDGELKIEDGGTVANNSGEIGFQLGSKGLVTVSGSNSKWINSGGLHIGSAGEGELRIKDGGEVSSWYGWIGAWENSQGQKGKGLVTVSGEGSQWTSEGEVSVGEQGDGELRITDGGVVLSGGGRIGLSESAKGLVTVSGEGSQWTSDFNISVGISGDGELRIEDGGVVMSGGGQIAYGGSGKGLVTVSGAGSQWTSEGGISIGSPDADAELRIENGGVVSGYGFIHSSGSGKALVTVGGEGSRWTGQGNFYIDGELSIVDGGAVSSDFGRIGYDGKGLVTVRDAGSQWNNWDLDIGVYGDGELRIDDGSAVSSNRGRIGWMAGSKGLATVSGEGSHWSGGELSIGDYGDGELRIEAGGTVSSDLGYIGRYTNSKGLVTVNGEGSTWTNIGDLILAGRDLDSTDGSSTGELVVSNGGLVNVAGTTKIHAEGTLRVNEGGALESYSLNSDGVTIIAGNVSVEDGFVVRSGGVIGGSGLLDGDLLLDIGAFWSLDLTHTLTVTGAVNIDSSFGIGSLLGLDETVDVGTYRLIDGTDTDFSTLGLQNWGRKNAYDLGNGKIAYFQAGSLELQIAYAVPEPETWVLIIGVGLVLLWCNGAKRYKVFRTRR